MQITHKSYQQENRWAYSLQIFNVNKLGIWLHRKQTYFKLRKRLYEVSWIFKRTCKNIIDFEKTKNVTVNKRRNKITSRCKRMIYIYISGKRILKNISERIIYWKVRNHYHYKGKCWDVAHSTCNLKFNVPNEIPQVFHKTMVIILS